MEHPCESSDFGTFNNGCWPIRIDRNVPLNLAIPIYGYVMPCVVSATLITNTFIVIVLVHKRLRTPTNYVLLAMAISELMTGLSSTPWMIYYFTLKGYQSSRIYGLPEFWCRTFYHFSVTIPTIFHTTAIWLTCYLAGQRYSHVVKNLRRRHLPNFRSAKIAITSVSLTAILVTLPSNLISYNVSYTSHQNASWTQSIGQRRYCVRRAYDWAYEIGISRVVFANFWFQAIFVYSLPCIICAVLTGLLIRTMMRQEKRREMLARAGHRSAARRSSRGKQHTKMLTAIVCLFLLTEVPAALIFAIHLMALTRFIPPDKNRYEILNTAIVFRNILIVISYPFRFAIYCGMSEQFRQVFKSRFWCTFGPNEAPPTVSSLFSNGIHRPSLVSRPSKDEVTDYPSPSRSPIAIAKLEDSLKRGCKRSIRSNNSQRSARLNSQSIFEEETFV